MDPQVTRPRRVQARHVLLLSAALILAAGGPVRSQEAKPPAAGTAGAAPVPTSPVPPAPDAAYHYDPAGRRDPFVSPLQAFTDLRPVRRAQGLAGVGANDLSVKGIVESNGAFVAMVEGPEGRTYLAHVNDPLADGRIKAITLTEVVIEQDVHDPLSPVKEREIRKRVGGPTK
jgi:Tfp pilus assembly protein PilP